jgi:serine/threonine protein kinase
MPSDQGSKTLVVNPVAEFTPPTDRPAHDPSSRGNGIFRIDHTGATSPDEKTIISKTPAGESAPPPLILTTAHLGQTLIGKRLDHYELVEFVGGGGMGAVFRANDTRLGRTVAVKVLSRDQTDDDTIRRFRNEAQSAARLDHPNIARVHFVGEDAGWNYIVFEFIEGVNLRDLVEKKGPLSIDDALNYTLQVAQALAHSSSRDVVHRDIKPSNVLVTPTGVVKLVDMGLARLHQVESSSDDLTASGVTLGTFDYISPEQARDPRSADVRSDIYSLGCTLYFMLVGRPPFPDGTALQKLLRHNGDDPPDARLFRPELSPKVSGLLDRMLSKRPSHRQQTSDVLIHEILALGNQLGLEFARRQNDGVSVTTAPVTWWDRLAPIAIPIIVLGVVLVILDALLPPSTSTADISLQHTFTKPPLVVGPSNAGPSKTASSLDNAAADLQTRPIVNPDRSLRRDVPPRTIDPAKSAIDPALGDDPAPMSGSNPRIVPETNGVRAAPSAGNSGVNTPATDSVGSTRPLTVIPLTVGAPPDQSLAPMSAGGNAPMTMAPTMETKPIVTRLIVQPRAAGAIVGGVETVDSLALACRRSAETGATEIELHFDGDLIEKPFEIASSRLNIRAGAGFRPRIVFKPELATSVEQRQMIRVTAGATTRLNIAGVMLRMELPVEPSFGWAMFAMQPAQTLEVSDSILTIQDGETLVGPVHDQVSFFHVLPRRMADSMKMEDDMAMAPQLTIGLTRSIVRGEATMISMPDESPLKLVWNQGLLVVTGRLIETGGTALKPKWFGRIEIDLDHVTVVAQEGVHQMRRKGGTGHQLDVDVRSNRSILFTAPETAVFEFADVPTVDDVKLTFDGADNCYPRPDVVFVRVKPSTPGEETQTFDLENRSRWSSERRPDLGVTWKSPAGAEIPLHNRTKLHYAQDDGAMNDAGFDPSLLPDAAKTEADLTPPAALRPALDDRDDPAPSPPTTVPSEKSRTEKSPPMPTASPTGTRIPAPTLDPMSRLNRSDLR